ncbi:MAG: AzlC family ABC transporter permease [Clostridium sp.]
MNSSFINGAKTATPIVIGFIPVATAFGMVAMNAGLSLFQCVFMSFMVFGGASQLMAVTMLASGVGVLQIIIATFAINFRHFVMGMSVMPRLAHIPKSWNIALFFGLTDETFAVLSLKNEDEEVDKYYVAGLNFTAFAAWVIGTLLGGFFIQFIPEFIRESMIIAIYGLFIGLLVPAVKSNHRGLIIAILGMFFNYIFSNVLNIGGWSLVLATILAGSFGIILFRGEK